MIKVGGIGIERDTSFCCVYDDYINLLNKKINAVKKMNDK
jgi:hypothetical protein